MNVSKRWNTTKTAVYNISYHIIWCPKYRRSLLTNGIDKRLKELLLKKASEKKWIIKKMEVMPDHVHIFISCKPTDSPQNIIQNLKGYTSFILRKEYPALKELPTLWTRSYYIESVGHISEKTILKYIQNQKLK